MLLAAVPSEQLNEVGISVPPSRYLLKEPHGASNPITRAAEHAYICRKDGPFDNLNSSRSMTCNRAVGVHFLGHSDRYDETLTSSSWRIAPFRTRSSRPVDLCMQRVREIIDNTGMNTCVWGAVKGSMEVRLRCLWLMQQPGCGLLRVQVPPTLTIGELLREFCAIMNIQRSRAAPVLLQLETATRFALSRRSGQPFLPEKHDNIPKSSASASASEVFGWLHSPGVTPLDPECSLHDADVKDGDTIDIVYSPEGPTRTANRQRFF